MKRILFLVEDYYPKTSGVPVVVKYLAEGMAKYNKYDICVATKMVGGRVEKEVYNGVCIHRFNIRNNYLKRATGNVDEYLSFIINGHFDVIILECTQCVTTDAVLPILNQLESKVILHSHGFSGLSLVPFKIMSSFKATIGNTLNFYIWKKYYTDVFPKYINFLSHILCLSKVDNDYKYLKKYNVPISILPNAADEIFFKNIDVNNLEKYIPQAPQNYIVNVSYYSEVKNQIGILKEFFRAKTCENMALIFIGPQKNSYYRKLERQYFRMKSQGRNLHKVYMLTGVAREDIPGIVKNATLYVSGSRREAFSVSLIEAMAVGTPFVGTNVGNTAELPGGLVVDNICEMHTQIDLILNDNFLYKMLQQNGIKYAYNECRTEKVLERLCQIIEEE